MTARPRPLVAGNWKMNGLRASLAEVAAIRDAVSSGGAGRAEVAICPPATLVAAVADLCKGSDVATGGQDCHASRSGAHTGDISAEMLADAGATCVIVGHSERRTLHQGNGRHRFTRQGRRPSWQCGPYCHSSVSARRRPQREAGKTRSKSSDGQLRGLPGRRERAPSAKLVVAYEPVWAIGTGLTPTPCGRRRSPPRHSCAAICRAAFATARAEQGFGILYGGSVKPSNAAELLAD